MPEDSLGGTAAMSMNMNIGPTGKSNWAQRLIFGGKGLTGTATAGLKFDIPGLEAFRGELVKIKDAIKELNTTFNKLAAAPKAFAVELEKVNKQLVTMNQNAGKVKDIKLLGTGDKSAGSVNLPGTASQQMSTSALPPGAQGGGQGAAMAGALSGVGSMVTKMLSAPFDRMQSGNEAAKANDVWLSRLALSTGRTGRQEQTALGKSQPFLGTSNDISQTMYMLSQQGYVIGGQGVGGQRGQAAAQSVRGLQSLSPGMQAPEAAQMVMGQAANISAQYQAAPLFGQAAFAYTGKGELKTLDVRFREVLDMMKTKRMGGRSGQPFTKDELIASQIPGSVMNVYLSSLGWDNGLIGQFMSWAIADAQYGPGFKGTEDQYKQLRGVSIAEQQEEVTTKKAEREFKYGGAQYGAISAQQGWEMKLISVLEGLDRFLRGTYEIANRLPTGWGQAGANIIGANIDMGIKAGTTAMGGGTVGDPPGLSQLNPDVRSRIGNMMEANPNLKVVSGRRTDADQDRLRRSGNPNIAPRGKSHHTRGAAADLGPASQYGWIQRNAKKFGLDHAAGMGEPWHVQLAGTMHGIGDIDINKRASLLQAYSAQAQQIQWAQFMREQQGSGGAAGAIQEGVDTAASNIEAAVSAAAGGGSGVSGGAVLSWDELTKVAYNAGFRGEALQKMVAIAGAESHRNPGAYNPVNKDNSYGLWQINMIGNLGPARLKQFGLTSNDQLYDPDTNAAAAFKVSGGGTNLTPWTTYTGVNDKNKPPPYKQFMDEAETAIKGLGYGDLGYGGGGSGGSSQTSVHHTPVSFNNTFNISVAGGSGGDVSGLVKQIASKLEVQMQRAQTTRR